MKIDMNHKIRELDGSVAKERVPDLDNEGNPKRDAQGFPLLIVGNPLTLRSICVRVLTNPPSPGVDKMTGREKEVSSDDNIKYAGLAERINKTKDLIDLPAEEIALLKKFVNLNFNRSPLIVKQVFDTLDPTTKN